MKEKQCPFCKDGLLARQTIKETYTYKGHSLEVNQPGEFCNSCEEGILNGADLKATEKVIQDFQAQIDVGYSTHYLANSTESTSRTGGFSR
jgi:HTH-type transcriptional regulator/antitoxin MqsA